MKQNSYTVFFSLEFSFFRLVVCLVDCCCCLVVLLGYETEYQYRLKNRKYYLEIPNANLLFWNRKKQNKTIHHHYDFGTFDAYNLHY